MSKIKFLALVLAIASFASVSVSAIAAEEGVKSSYALKKQGKVPFEQKEEQDEAASVEEPASIEPAAGAEEPTEEPSEESDLSEQLKLPRKN